MTLILQELNNHPKKTKASLSPQSSLAHMLGNTLATSKGFCGLQRFGTLGTLTRFLDEVPSDSFTWEWATWSSSTSDHRSRFWKEDHPVGPRSHASYFGKHFCSSVLVILKPHTVHGAWDTVRGTPQGRSSMVVMTDVPLPQNPPRADPGQKFWH